VKITVTHHDEGRSFRTTRERFISMKQALDIHDPFINPALKGLANGPNFDKSESFGPEWRDYFYPKERN
jgi:hypothetical protein